MGLKDDFVSRESREYKFRLGNALASALAGFVVGSLSASIIWYFILRITEII
ncbi:MAG: hypothetical protein WD712_01750 [Candidatus Spechtbacterales bacterium]